MKKFLLSIIALTIISISSIAKDKANVLIIGDSISVGYAPFVIEELKDIANVERIRGNAQSTATGAKAMKGGKLVVETYIEGKDLDVIHFNYGLHDLCYRNPEAKNLGSRDKINGKKVLTIEEYEANLQKIIDVLKTTNAKLIFATTTYVPEGEEGRFVGDEIKYNEVATRVMKKNNVMINPLYELSIGVHKEYGSGVGNVHYKKEGSQLLAKQVSEYIRKVITEK